MSKIAISGASTGTATFTIESPATSTNRTITIPDATTTLVGTDATQTLTNKTVQGGTVQSATAQASTSGTSIDFTGIPSWVKRVTVMFNGVSTNGSSNIQFQIGDSGGVETTGYLGTGLNAATTVASSTYTSGWVTAGQASDATVVLHGQVTISNLTGNVWVATGFFGRSDSGGIFYTAGSKTLSDILTQIRITTVNGTDTFDAGSINILYE